jgi:Undecaprenyl-phosphate galactose phosphotransferase WbaP
MEQRLELTPQQVLVPVDIEHKQPQVATEGRWWAQKQWAAPVGLILSDVLLALLVWEVAFIVQSMGGHGELSKVTAVSLAPVVALWVALRALLGLYPGYGLDAVEELRRHTYGTFVALAMLAIFALASQIENFSRLQLALVFLGLLFTAPLARYLVKWAMNVVGLWGKPVLVLSYKDSGTNILGDLRQRWTLGYQPFAVLGYRLDSVRESPEGANDKRLLDGAKDLARTHGVNTLIFAMPHTRREHLAKLVSLASLSFRHVLVIPNLGGITNSAVVARDLAGTFAVEIKFNLLNPWTLRAKRAADLIATVVGGVLMSPLFFVLAALVYLESGSPIFYKDWRLGKDGQLFLCIKFRTMVSNAETLLQRMLEEDIEFRKEYAKYHKLRNDPRVTRVGRFLRATSLDELPQVWNVLRGEMSLVGPRPYLPRESTEIGVTQSEILRVSPGITGPWQVSGRNHASFSERIQMDVHYVRDWSVWLDIVLLARTVKALLLDRAAY